MDLTMLTGFILLALLIFYVGMNMSLLTAGTVREIVRDELRKSRLEQQSSNGQATSERQDGDEPESPHLDASASEAPTKSSPLRT